MLKFESNFEKPFYNLHSTYEVAQNRKDKRDWDVRTMAKDFVCGMELNEQTTRHLTEFEGKTFYFCSHWCMLMFKED